MSTEKLDERQSQIEQNFSKYAYEYDKNALIHRHCAKQLMECLGLIHTPLVEGPILELGCGTGFVSQELLAKLPKRDFVISDISTSMLSICAQNLQIPRSATVRFQMLDGENVEASELYSLIISGLTFQWFQDIGQALKQCLAALKPKGLLAVSLLGSKSFPEWHQCCAELQIPCTANPMPDVYELERIEMKTLIYQEKVPQIYPNALQFFKSLKKIGAGTNLNEEKLTPSQMRRLINYWDACSPDGIRVTYEVIYLIFQKGS